MFKRKEQKPPYELVTDGEKWAIKETKSGDLLYNTECVSPFFTHNKTEEKCWMKHKADAEQKLKRLLV